ncbi:MAG: ATP-binding protein [Bacteroidota bacterium]|nr:ATP-binding protein [Bacteroidota bacterium]MDQ6888812.1 ATP-binding protein [Bacteroidota bacterium]
MRTIYILYWVLLSYIVAALIFWFIALNSQNRDLTRYRLDMIDVNDENHEVKQKRIEDSSNRKATQYLGEGIAFFLLIVTGAVYVFRAINRQLHQSQQQQNFMMAITHELKTPIAVTKLNLETLQKRLLNPEQQQKLIRTTIQEADRLNALCNNMLLTSQFEAGGYSIIKEKIDLTELVKECAHDFKVRFPFRKIETKFNGKHFVSGDKMLLHLAVNNLLDNAIKYSGREDIVLLKIFKENNLLKLQIIDEGPGIVQAEKGRIFEKYFRGANRQTKGTGLGLYLTKKIIKEHNGHIHVANNDPRGSIFEISFAEQKNL